MKAKDFVRLNALELGQVWANLDKMKLTPALRKKFEQAVRNVYGEKKESERG